MSYASYARFLKQQAYIDGCWCAADSGSTLDVTNPATGDLLGTVPDMGAAEADRAIAAAERSRRDWAARTAGDRARILRRLYDLMLANQDALAELLTREQGKPLAEARGEIAYAAAFLEWFAEEGKRAYGEVIPAHAGNRRIVCLKQPLGVVGAITPWNFPSAMIARKMGP
ncbi:aldehyde dehydrogenase family protein, partial [Azospirillum sp. B4]|uniref:aldehyde dehydrogenase family protein n=1 Tax=Azospirillum sp. B4 TaxID=95605 RepID=UPI0005C95125